MTRAFLVAVPTYRQIDGHKIVTTLAYMFASKLSFMFFFVIATMMCKFEVIIENIVK